MRVATKMITVMDHMSETCTLASVLPEFEGEMELWEAHRMVRKHIAMTERDWSEVTEHNSHFYDRDGCKVYRIVVTYYGPMSVNRDVFYVRSLYNHYHDEYNCETCADRFVYANCD